jgi:hypothetical protein
VLSRLGSSAATANGEAGAGKRAMDFITSLADVTLSLFGMSFTTCPARTSPMSEITPETSSALAMYPNSKTKERAASMV